MPEDKGRIRNPMHKVKTPKPGYSRKVLGFILGSEQALAPCRRAGILRRRGLPQSPEKSEVIESFTATSNHDRFLTLRAQIEGTM